MTFRHRKYKDKDKLIQHKPYCIKPKIIRRYEKGYNNEDKRTLILASLKCVGCGVILELSHKPSLTTKQREKLMKNIPELPSPEALQQDLELDSQVNNEDIDNEYLYTEGKTIERTKEVQPVINRREKKFRAEVKELNSIYKKDEKDCPRLKGKINWDTKLLARFLDTRPSLDIIRKLLLWPPLLRYNRKRGDETRGWIPDPNDWGHTKYDNDTFKISWNKAWKKERELTDPNNLSAGEKLLIVEAKGRMEFMRSVIKKYNESQNQVYYTTDEIKIKNRKKKKSIS